MNTESGCAVLVVNENSPFRIFLHHVRVAEAHSFGKLRPTVDRLVGVIAVPQNRLGAAGFVVGVQNERHAGDGGAGARVLTKVRREMDLVVRGLVILRSHRKC